ncbi:PIG-L deacetylase family protein [Qipengyuania zhejiangensis]|uniref:PIG-L deacetylase family protein n=1 Tax=Qipengyuania zhejiangensis TaxID=3077782 RepID=UPI002D77125D|nr:PIG-L deacetylase family protein [Qipengyuania sp. Z2]
MSVIQSTRTALVIAPHPDDEVLGCGGTISRLVASGATVDVAIVTRGMPPAYTQEHVDQVHGEAKAAHTRLGVRNTHFLDFPAAQLDQVPQAELNQAVRELMLDVQPDTIFVPFVGDIHVDHKLVFGAAMVASRPAGGFRPDRILAYETLSETNWSAPYLSEPFVPNVFVNIEDHIDSKIEAFEAFASQCRPFPNERSTQALRALASVRGACVHVPAAEAFVLVRDIAG